MEAVPMWMVVMIGIESLVLSLKFRNKIKFS
jgi:hypothetical protein